MNKKIFYKKMYNEIKRKKEKRDIKLWYKIKIRFFLDEIQNKLLNSISNVDFSKDEITARFTMTLTEFRVLFGEDKIREGNIKYFQELCEKHEINYNFTYINGGGYSWKVKCRNPYKEQNKTLKKC